MLSVVGRGTDPERMKAARLAASMSQAQAAKAANVTQRQIRRRETERRPCARVETVLALADAYGVDPNALFEPGRDAAA